jgi:hypothetical protein
MDLDQGYWMWVLENTLSNIKGVDPLVKGESRSAGFGTKVAPYLWRADPSFMNSVTGSSYVAKCSNIIQEIFKYLLLLIVSSDN